jgi:hypothetical protein
MNDVKILYKGCFKSTPQVEKVSTDSINSEINVLVAFVNEIECYRGDILEARYATMSE